MTIDKNIKVAVLMGGVGSEREVSFESGTNIAAAIACAGMTVITSDITPDDLSILDDNSIDVFFLGLHGKFGEDGQLQKILESRNLIYTGSKARASRDAFNKTVSKEIFARSGVALARHVCVSNSDTTESISDVITRFGGKFVVKPITQGSSVGVEIIEGAWQAAQAAVKCFNEFGDCMIEEFISGKEITVGILNGKTLPVTEIVSKSGFYDYKAKYKDDSTEYLFNTITDAAVIDEINRSALVCFNSLGCRHQGRVDMILTGDNVPYVLEINTLPGFTKHSLLPMAAKKAGISPEDLCLDIIRAALTDK